MAVGGFPGSFPVRAGACQAPQTTATRSAPSCSTARNWVRMYASRRSSLSWWAGRSAGVSSRSSAIASVIASNGLPPVWLPSGPTARDSITSSHQRSGSSYPAADDSIANGSPRTPFPRVTPGSSASPSPSSSSADSPGSDSASCDSAADPGFAAGLTCPASTIAAGRSQNRTVAPCRNAQVSACHSGENTANGQNAECAG